MASSGSAAARAIEHGAADLLEPQLRHQHLQQDREVVDRRHRRLQVEGRVTGSIPIQALNQLMCFSGLAKIKWPEPSESLVHQR